MSPPVRPVQEQEDSLDSIRNRPKTKISASHRDYLRSQISHMVAAGASQKDVLEFLRLEGVSVPQPVSVEQFDPEVPEPVRRLTTMQGLAGRAIQGITWGFGDEAVGSLLGLLSGEGARGGIERFRREVEEWSAANKGKGFVAELAGSLLTGKALFNLVRGGLQVAGRAVIPNVVSRLEPAAQGIVGRGLQVGAVSGGIAAVAGAGHAEGGISDRARGAITGGVVGGGLGFVAPGAARLLGTVTKPIARAVTSFSKKLQSVLPGVGSSDEQARELILQALQRDGVSIPQALQRLNNLAAQGLKPTIVDIGGPAMDKLVQESLLLRTVGKQKMLEMFINREVEQTPRMMGALVRKVFRSNRLGSMNAFEAEEVLISMRRTLADPLYRAAHQEVVQVTPRMRAILQHPAFRKAYQEGARRAKTEDLSPVGHGLPVSPLPKGNLRAKLRSQLEALNVPKERIEQELAKIADDFPSELPVRGIDFMKRNLDTFMDSLDEQHARPLRAMLNEVLQESTTQSRSFGEALVTWGGISQARDALLLGQKFIGKEAGLVAKEVGKLAPQLRDFYRLGAMQALQKRAMSTTAEIPNAARRYFGGRLFGTPNMDAQRIRALFPDAPEVGNDVMRMIAGEATLSHHFAQSGMAARAGRATVQEGVDLVEGSLPPAVRATPGVMALAAARIGVVRLRQGWSNKVSDDLAVMFAKGLQSTDEVRTFLGVLAHMAAKSGRRGLLAAAGFGEFVGQSQ